jgi:hypothetical protein
MTAKPLTPEEKAFCLRYALDPLDPIGAYAEAFKPADPLARENGPAVAALIDREDIQLETWFQKRLLADHGQGRLLAELEEARQKALKEETGAELAGLIAILRAQLAGIIAMPQASPAPSGLSLAQALAVEETEIPETVH